MKSNNFDLIVVGAGIAGLSSAYLYKQAFPEHNVLVIERQGRGPYGKFGYGIGRGLTGRSGGHRMPGFEADFGVLEGILGENDALYLYAETMRTLDQTDAIIAREGIECGAYRGYWVLDDHESKFDRLDEFLSPRRKLGLAEPQIYKGNDLKHHVSLNGYNVGLHISDIASFDPPKFLFGLAEALMGMGCHIQEGCGYVEHNRTRRGSSRRYKIKTIQGDTLYADQLVLAGGDVLSRKIPFLNRYTFPVYTARVAVKLTKEEFRRVSPQGCGISFCDTDLKRNDDVLDGDNVWCSVRPDGYMVMGFGGCLPALTANMTERQITKMKDTVREGLLQRAPFLRGQKRQMKLAVGGLNTSTNLLPIIGHIDGEEGVIGFGAQSGVGLNQSVLMADAWVRMLKGDTRNFDLLTKLQSTQIIIPTFPPAARSLTLHAGMHTPRPVRQGVERMTAVVKGLGKR